MWQIELEIPNVKFHSFTSKPTSAVYMLTSLYSQYTFLRVLALKGPSSGTTDTFCEQGEQNVWFMLRNGCQTAAYHNAGCRLI